MVEIAKALYRQPRVLILDEPTSSLSATETKILTDLLERLRDEGIAILYISHRLNEVMALCEHVTVLKDGVRTADQPLEGIDAAGLVRLMVGRDPGDLFPAWQPSGSRRAVVSVRNFAAGVHARRRPRHTGRRNPRHRRARRPGPGGSAARPLRRDPRHGADRPSVQRNVGPSRQRSEGQCARASPMCRPTASARGCTSSIRSPPI